MPDVDDLSCRIVQNQLADEARRVAQEAERLSEMALQLARSATGSSSLGGDASRIVQAAGALLERAARLDGKREIAHVAGLDEAVQPSPAVEK
ncbi:hypothetical protein [Streptomyces sp. WAC08241]|uniref:hypothetical protein n=1 Tax=Streptomyces sp. WAC08241 TaxID=2487421 RepID=UPI000F7A141E|nr:hypothetical protein [Streptomyces sp. WAC08241]RSS43842.1 hypothetical protein EF906_08835 [Streptomyces sp. WAC08241]